MAIQDTSLNPKIISSAKEEFLEKGFIKTSLSSICKKAGVTTGALYKRYKGKEDLFDAIVQPTLDNLNNLGTERLSNSMDKLEKNEMNKLWQDAQSFLELQTNLFYDNYDGLRLLLLKSEGTKHNNFFESMVKQNVDITYEYSKKVYEKGLSSKLIQKYTLEVLLTAYWKALLTPVINGYSREQALEITTTLSHFFNWKEVLGY